MRLCCLFLLVVICAYVPAEEQTPAETDAAGQKTPETTPGSKAESKQELKQQQEREVQMAKALAGGTVLPQGQFSYQFPAHAKQHIQFVAQADKIQTAVVVFNGGSLGTMNIDTLAGSGSGELAFRARQISSGDTGRDELLHSAKVLDAEQFPKLALRQVVLKRIGPTVYRVDAQCHIRDVQRPLRFYVNMRLIKKLPGFGEQLVRIKGSFPLDLSTFGIQSIDEIPAQWQVHVMLLGVLNKNK